jgi:hypothetical protein
MSTVSITWPGKKRLVSKPYIIIILYLHFERTVYVCVMCVLEKETVVKDKCNMNDYDIYVCTTVRMWL